MAEGQLLGTITFFEIKRKKSARVSADPRRSRVRNRFCSRRASTEYEYRIQNTKATQSLYSCILRSEYRIHMQGVFCILRCKRTEYEYRNTGFGSLLYSVFCTRILYSLLRIQEYEYRIQNTKGSQSLYSVLAPQNTGIQALGGFCILYSVLVFCTLAVCCSRCLLSLSGFYHQCLTPVLLSRRCNPRLAELVGAWRKLTSNPNP